MTKHFLYKFILLLTILINNTYADLSNYNKKQITAIEQKSIKYSYQSIPVLVLSGNKMEMGIQYGAKLNSEMLEALFILEEYYILEKGLTREQLIKQGNLLYDTYPDDYKEFMKGISIGSGGLLNLNDIKILNAMETLGGINPITKSNYNDELAKCAFLYIPRNMTTTGNGLIGRNYDYPEPFNQLVNYLSVIILKEPNKIPTAFISIAGEIYCPSCINQKGIFMELNNGSPSGGRNIRDGKTETMLIRMLSTLQDSNNLNQVVGKLNNQYSDFSLIINTADKYNSISFEFSSLPILGMHYYYPDINQPFVSTNFFLDAEWGNSIPEPSDKTTWNGVTRRNNLLKLSSQSNQFNVSILQKLMEKKISDGGAVWDLTIYQLIFDEGTLDLYVRTVEHPNKWVKIPLGLLFN